MRYLILSVSLVCGCGSPEPNNQIVRTGAEDFVSTHRLTPDLARKRFAGRLVQIYLPPGTYVCEGTTLRYHTGFEAVPAVIVFNCRDEQDRSDPASAAIVTGRYVGLIRDGIRRGGGIDWCASLVDCSVTRLSPRP